MRIFGHHVSRGAILLGSVDILLLYLCLLLALGLVSRRPDLVPLHHLEALAAAATVLLFLSILGVYERKRQKLVGMRGLADALRLVFGVLLGLAIVKGFNTLVFSTPFADTRVLALSGGLAVIALLLHRGIFLGIARLGQFKRRVLVLGVGTRALSVGAADGEGTGYDVVAYVASPGETSVDVPLRQVRRLEPGETLLGLAQELKLEEIVVAIRDRRGNLPIKQLLECKLQGITITDVSSFFEREQQQLQLDSLNTSWLVFGTGFRQDWFGHFVKRGFDLVASTLLLLVTLPIIVGTAIAIRLEGPGPILYWQTRVGLGNRNFQICKFRSMYPDAEKDGQARWAAGDDDRITRVGRVIRKVRIDELPQILNVFKGEMSFVGPRPERPVFVEQLSEQVPYFLARHSIRPGITGWAQVRYPYGASVQDARQKLQYDLYYLKNHTLFLDLVILLETVKVVLFGRGAR